MNQVSITDEERQVKIRKNDKDIPNPYSYSNSDNLMVYISDLEVEETNEYVFEIQGDGAVFVEGGCNGKRSTVNGAKLDLSKAVGPLTIVAGRISI